MLLVARAGLGDGLECVRSADAGGLLPLPPLPAAAFAPSALAASLGGATAPRHASSFALLSGDAYVVTGLRTRSVACEYDAGAEGSGRLREGGEAGALLPEPYVALWGLRFKQD